jgi:hypothetical protein
MLHAARHILNFARCMLRMFCCTLHASMRRTHCVRAAARMERLEKEKRERKEAGEQYLKNNGAAKLNSSAKGKRVDRAREHGQTTQKARVSRFVAQDRTRNHQCSRCKLIPVSTLIAIISSDRLALSCYLLQDGTRS